jgi:hypothetical protein
MLETISGETKVEGAARPRVGVGSLPDWAIKEMPSGYQTRIAEIERLSADIREMDRFARLLCEIGEPLEQVVRDVFAGLKFDVAPITPGVPSQFVVKLEDRRRLLVLVSSAESTIQKQSEAIEQVFHLVHKVAGEGDRVVLVANVDRHRPPSERADALAPDALALLRRLGANYLPSSTLFSVWMQSLQDQHRAFAALERLHALDGDVFPRP